jgi:hypothetical protein
MNMKGQVIVAKVGNSDKISDKNVETSDSARPCFATIIWMFPSVEFMDHRSQKDSCFTQSECAFLPVALQYRDQLFQASGQKILHLCSLEAVSRIFASESSQVPSQDCTAHEVGVGFLVEVSCPEAQPLDISPQTILF